MELEHEIMKCVVRIASGGRRRHHNSAKTDGPRFCGYGRILDLLSKNDGLSQREIAEILDIRPQSASEAIASMESQNLVFKQENAQDKRAYLVYITQEGRQRQIAIREEHIRNAKRIFAPLTDEEKTTLFGLLSKAVAALQENKEEC